MSTPTSKSSADDLPPIDTAILKAMRGLPSDFDDFGRIFQDQLQPELRANEGARLKAAEQAKRMTWLGAVVGVGGVLLGLLAFKVPQFAIVAGVVGFGIAGAGRSPLKKIAKQSKAMLVGPVASKFGLEFNSEPGPQSGADTIHRAGLLPGWDRSAFEDQITGTRNGVGFEFFEAHLEQRRTTRDGRGRSRTTWVSVFRGQCLRFQFHKTFHGRTLVLRDAGILNRFGGGEGMQRARLESPTFEKAFEVYTSDQVEARYLLTPDLMQRLVDLERVFHGGGLRCAFTNGEMLIALEGGDLFEPGSMFTPLDNPERVRDLLDDFASIFNLIDSFVDPQARLAAKRANDED